MGLTFTATLSCGAGPCPLPVACSPLIAGLLLLHQGTPSPAPYSPGGQMLRRRGEKSVSHTSATLKNFFLKNHLSNISEACLLLPCGQVTWGWSVMGEMEVPWLEDTWDVLWEGTGDWPGPSHVPRGWGGSWHTWALTPLKEADWGWGCLGVCSKLRPLSPCAVQAGLWWGPSSCVSDI